MEDTIRKAADKKFQELKGVIKSEVRKKVMEEMRADASAAIPSEALQATKADLKKEFLEEMQATKSPVVTPDDLRLLRDELLVCQNEVTPDDLKPLRDKVLGQVNSHDKELREEFRSHNNTSSEDDRYRKLKDQAYTKRLNIIIFSIADRNSDEDDLKEAHSFFSKKWVLCTTYSLGSFIEDPHYSQHSKHRSPKCYFVFYLLHMFVFTLGLQQFYFNS